MVALKDIRDFAGQVAERFKPERIVLFGSYARGTPHEDSDVDLLVVMRHPGVAWRQAAEITEQIPAPFPLDLLVRSPEQVKERIELEDWFMRDLIAEGKVLYEAAYR